MRRREFGLGLLGLAAAAKVPAAWGQSGDAAIDAFDQRWDERFRRFDQAVEDAFAAFDRRVEAVWGGDKQAPSRSRFVGFKDDLRTRVIVDYEEGVVAVESVEPGVSDEELERELQSLVEADSRVLDRLDVQGEAIEEALEDAGFDRPGSLRAQTSGARIELAPLIDRAAAPRKESKPIADGRGRDRTLQRVAIPMLPQHERLSADRVRAPVDEMAARYRVRRSVVIAVIKNESSFNPRARSHIPAFGLMQLVPRSGGKDAYRFLTGKTAAPTPDYLFQPVENIELGSIYLHILDSNYLDAVRDPESRMYCAIAAYNTGAGNVARAFVGSTNVSAAAAVINRMTPRQVYDQLLVKLPYDETRGYLRKVSRDQRAYRDWD